MKMKMKMKIISRIYFLVLKRPKRVSLIIALSNLNTVEDFI